MNLAIIVAGESSLIKAKGLTNSKHLMKNKRRMLR